VTESYRLVCDSGHLFLAHKIHRGEIVVGTLHRVGVPLSGRNINGIKINQAASLKIIDG